MSLLLNKECRLLFAKRLNLTYCVSFQELEQISETFQRLRAHKFQLEKELKFAKLHNETLSHHMAECEQAFDNVSQIK